MGELVAELRPDLVVIACNTASTLVLAPLREKFPELPFVGTVPAIKPAALASRCRLVSVLATPGTVARDYTRALVREFAGDCEVTLVGSARLAGLAERSLRGEPVDDAEIAAEIAPGLRRAGRAAHRSDRARLHAFSAARRPARRRRAVAGRLCRSGAGDRAPGRRAARAAGAAAAGRGGAGDVHAPRAPSGALQKALLARGLTVSSLG